MFSAACLLPDIPNGNYLDGYRGGLYVAHGSVLTYTCQEGYLQVTSKPLDCHMGNLTPFTPKCIREGQTSTSSFGTQFAISSFFTFFTFHLFKLNDSVNLASCKVPLVEDGSYHTGNQELMLTQSVQHDVQITLSCYPGFVQSGNEHLKCRFGEWATNGLPKCLPGILILIILCWNYTTRTVFFLKVLMGNLNVNLLMTLLRYCCSSI